jgi:hypothetical protein
LAHWKPWLRDLHPPCDDLGKKSKKAAEPKGKASSLDPDFLIEPSILEAAQLVKVGDVDRAVVSRERPAVTIGEMAWRMIEIGWEPSNTARLATILRFNPGLYWDPLVERQILYLRRLQSDEREWRRLAWQWQSQGDGEYEVYTPPNEVAIVDQQLRNLLEAHAAGLFPEESITWRSGKKLPGPKGGLRNPYPTWDPASRLVQVWFLYFDFQALREAFGARLQSAKDRPLMKAEMKDWYRNLAQQVLQDSSVGWWSACKDSESQEHGVPRWWPLNLDAALGRMLQGKTNRDGKAAYLACAVLSSLLDVKPEKIRNMIDNYVHRRRVKKG